MVDEQTKKHLIYLASGAGALFFLLMTLLFFGGLLFVTIKYPILPLGGVAFLLVSYILGRTIEK